MEVGKENTVIHNNSDIQRHPTSQQQKQANFDFRGKADGSESWKASKKLYAEFAYSPPKRAVDKYVSMGGKVKSKEDLSAGSTAQASNDFNMVGKLRSMFDDKPAAGTKAPSTQGAYHNRQLLTSQTGQSGKPTGSNSVETTGVQRTRNSLSDSGDEAKLKSNFAKFNLPPHGGSILSARKARFEQGANTNSDPVFVKKPPSQRKPPIKLDELIKKDSEVVTERERTTPSYSRNNNGIHGDNHVISNDADNIHNRAAETTTASSVARRTHGKDDKQKNVSIRPSSQEFAGLEENIQVYGNKSINIQSFLSPHAPVDGETPTVNGDDIYDDIQPGVSAVAAESPSLRKNVTLNGSLVHNESKQEPETYESLDMDTVSSLKRDDSYHSVSERVLPESDFNMDGEEGITAVRVTAVHNAPTRYFDSIRGDSYNGPDESYTELNGQADFNEEENIYEDLDAVSNSIRGEPSSIYDDALSLGRDASNDAKQTSNEMDSPDNWQMVNEDDRDGSQQQTAEESNDGQYTSTSEDDSEDDEGHPDMYSLPPPPSHSCLAHDKPRRKAGSVTFRETVRTVVPTYSPWEYDRANMEIDPVTASAEWELEKRVEKMDIFSVDLQKGDRGLGLSIIGLGVGTESGVEKLGIFVKTLTPGGSAQRDGRIQVNDQILEVNYISLVGVTQQFAAYTLKNTSGVVRFLMGRDKNRRHYTLANPQDVNLQELEKMHNEEMNDLLNRLQESEERANELENVLEDVKLTLAETEERTYIAEGAVEELKQELHLMKQKTDDRKKTDKLDELQRSLQDVSAKLSSSEDSLLKLYDEKEEKHGELQSLREQLQDSEMMCSRLQEENATLLSDLEARSNELGTTNTDLTKSKSDHAELIKHVDAYRERYERLERELEESRAHDVGSEVVEKLSEVEHANRDHINVIENLRDKNDRLMQRVRELEKTIGVKETMALKLAQENDYLQDLVSKLDHSEKEARNEAQVEEYKQLAKMHEMRATAMELELKKAKETTDNDKSSKKYFNDDIDAAPASIPVARVGPKIIKQESVSSSSNTLSRVSLQPVESTPTPATTSTEDENDYENMRDDQMMEQTVSVVEQGMDFSVFDGLPPDEPRAASPNEKQYINPVPKPPRKVSKEEMPGRGQQSPKRQQRNRPVVSEDNLSEQTLPAVESAALTDEQLLAALDRTVDPSGRKVGASDASSQPAAQSGKLLSSSDIPSYKYEPDGKLFPDFSDMPETNVDDALDNESAAARAEEDEFPTSTTDQQNILSASKATAAHDPADKRSSFLDALQQDPNFGTWLKDSISSPSGREPSEDHADQIVGQVISVSPDHGDATPVSATSPVLSDDENNLSVGAELEERRNTIKLHESYLNATGDRSGSGMPTEEPSPLHPDKAVDTEDGPVDFSVVPWTDTLDTSAQRDKLKVAAERERRKPSHGSMGSPRSPTSEVDMDFSDGADAMSAEGSRRSVQTPTSPLSDDSQKEKSKKFNFHFPKIPGLRKMHKRPSDDQLNSDADRRKRRNSREKRHSMYDARPSADYGEEDVVPLSAKSEISLQQKLNDAATDEAVVPLHDKLRAHHSAGEETTGRRNTESNRDDVFSSGASSVKSDALSPTLSAGSLNEGDPNNQANTSDAHDGASNKRPLIGGPIDHWQQRPVNEWDTRQVGLWLIGMDLSHFVKAFHDKSIDGEHLLALDTSKLKDLGVYNGDERTRIKKKIKDFRLAMDREQKGKDVRHGGKRDPKGKETRTKKLFWKGRYTVND